MASFVLFTEWHMNLQLSQNKKFNLKTVFLKWKQVIKSPQGSIKKDKYLQKIEEEILVSKYCLVLYMIVTSVLG